MRPASSGCERSNGYSENWDLAMIPPDEAAALNDLFTDLLLAGDRALAASDSRDALVDLDIPDNHRPRLESALACAQLLRQCLAPRKATGEERFTRVEQA